jgi:hypothetical protein
MRKTTRLYSCLVLSVLLSSCSPRDYLTRRLAADLIAGSSPFRVPQNIELHTGVISNKDFLSPEYLALQHHGWISSSKVACPPATDSPCVEVSLTPSGVEVLQGIVPASDAEKQFFAIPAAKRELIAVSGISKQGYFATVEFTWHWQPLNEVGAAFYPGDARYRSYAAFRLYDDGWRVVTGTAHVGQPLDDALKNAEPAQ